MFDELRRRHLSVFSNPTTFWRGRRLTEVAPGQETNCIGSIDGVVAEGRDKPFVRLTGWAYVRSQKRPPSLIAVVDRDGTIIGLGYSTGNRPDVPRSFPDIGSADIAWQAVVDVTPPLTDYRVYAVTQTAAATTACRL